MMQDDAYQPPYKLTSAHITLVAEIAEAIGHRMALDPGALKPRLRRDSQARSIHASLAIENNTLSLAQVTAVIAGKPVLAHPREIQEVRNALQAYETMPNWRAVSESDLLAAHLILMGGLHDEAGRYRSGGVGIYRADQLMHLAPPAERVPYLMADLFKWLETTDAHPLITSCIFHYELEFIHPFADGNGRIGRLWQSLLLRQWKPIFAYLPVETLIHQNQQAYYQALALSDQSADAGPLMLFMLRVIRELISQHSEELVAATSK